MSVLIILEIICSFCVIYDDLRAAIRARCISVFCCNIWIRLYFKLFSMCDLSDVMSL